MADIGEKLRSAREDKGLTIADIEKATKIQSRYLNAIEEDDFDKLPGDFYVRAFIRQYAQIVGLDGKELLSEYHKDVPESKPDEYVENSIDNKSEEVRETTNNKKDLWKNYLPRIAVGLGVIIVVLIIYFLYAKISSSGQNNNSNNVAVTSQSSSKKSSSKPKSTVRIIKVAPGQYRVLGLKQNRKLVVKGGDQATNATISINGTVQWQNQLNAGEKHALLLPEDAHNVVVTFGNDSGTSVTIAGKKVPYTATGSNLSLTLLIGKQRQSSSSQSSTTTNSGYSSSTQRQSQSSQVQSSTRQSSQAQSNQQNNQSGQNNGNNNQNGQHR